MYTSFLTSAPEGRKGERPLRQWRIACFLLVTTAQTAHAQSGVEDLGKKARLYWAETAPKRKVKKKPARKQEKGLRR